MPKRARSDSKASKKGTEQTLKPVQKCHFHHPRAFAGPDHLRCHQIRWSRQEELLFESLVQLPEKVFNSPAKSFQI